MLYCGFLRHVKSINPGCQTLLKTTQIYTTTLPSLFIKQQSEGVGRQTLSSEGEKMLWDLGRTTYNVKYIKLPTKYFFNSKPLYKTPPDEDAPWYSPVPKK